MAGQVSILDDGYVVDAALTGGVKRYTAVVISGDHTVTYGAAANAAKFIGIAQEDKDAGETANIRQIGNTYAIAKGAITAGDSLIIGDAVGSVSSVGATATPNVIGKALTSAAADGDFVLITIG